MLIVSHFRRYIQRTILNEPYDDEWYVHTSYWICVKGSRLPRRIAYDLDLAGAGLNDGGIWVLIWGQRYMKDGKNKGRVPHTQQAPSHDPRGGGGGRDLLSDHVR